MGKCHGDVSKNTWGLTFWISLGSDFSWKNAIANFDWQRMSTYCNNLDYLFRLDNLWSLSSELDFFYYSSVSLNVAGKWNSPPSKCHENHGEIIDFPMVDELQQATFDVSRSILHFQHVHWFHYGFCYQTMIPLSRCPLKKEPVISWSREVAKIMTSLALKRPKSSTIDRWLWLIIHNYLPLLSYYDRLNVCTNRLNDHL